MTGSQNLVEHQPCWRGNAASRLSSSFACQRLDDGRLCQGVAFRCGTSRRLRLWVVCQRVDAGRRPSTKVALRRGNAGRRHSPRVVCRLWSLAGG